MMYGKYWLLVNWQMISPEEQVDDDEDVVFPDDVVIGVVVIGVEFGFWDTVRLNVAVLVGS